MQRAEYISIEFTDNFFAIPKKMADAEIRLLFHLPPKTTDNLYNYLKSPDGKKLLNAEKYKNLLAILYKENYTTLQELAVSGYTEEINFLIDLLRDNNFEAFLNSKNGECYRQGIKELIEQFTQWVKDNDLYDDKAKESLEEFANKFLYYGKNEYTNKRIFPLFGDGVTNFAKIIILIKNDEISLDKRRRVVKNLLPGLAVCVPGTNTNIYNARLNLVSDFSSQLHTIRRNIAEAVAKEVIIGKSIPESMEIHYVNMLLNHHSTDLALELVEDAFANMAIDNQLVKAFQRKIKIALTPYTVIDAIMQELYDNEFLAALFKKNPKEFDKRNPNYITDEDRNNFQLWMDQYGEDKHFIFSNLDYDSDNDTHGWRYAYQNYIYTSLVHRLVQSGYFAAPEMMAQKFVAQVSPREIAQVYILPERSLREAYIVMNDRVMPFIPCCLTLLRANQAEFKIWLSGAQRAEMQAAMLAAVKHEWQALIAAEHIDQSEKIAWLTKFTDRLMPNLPGGKSLLVDLVAMFEDAELRYQYREKFQLAEEVSHVQTPNQLAVYLRLFPATEWEERAKRFPQIDLLNCSANSLANFLKVTVAGNFILIREFKYILQQLAYEKYIELLLNLDPVIVTQLISTDIMPFPDSISPDQNFIRLIAILSKDAGIAFLGRFFPGLELKSDTFLISKLSDEQMTRFIIASSYVYAGDKDSNFRLFPWDFATIVNKLSDKLQYELVPQVHPNFIIKSLRPSIQHYLKCFNSEKYLQALQILPGAALAELFFYPGYDVFTYEFKQVISLINKADWPGFVKLLYKVNPDMLAASPAFSAKLLSVVPVEVFRSVLDALREVAGDSFKKIHLDSSDISNICNGKSIADSRYFLAMLDEGYVCALFAWDSNLSKNLLPPHLTTRLLHNINVLNGILVTLDPASRLSYLKELDQAKIRNLISAAKIETKIEMLSRFYSTLCEDGLVNVADTSYYLREIITDFDQLNIFIETLTPAQRKEYLTSFGHKNEWLQPLCKMGAKEKSVRKFLSLLDEEIFKEYSNYLLWNLTHINMADIERHIKMQKMFYDPMQMPIDADTLTAYFKEIGTTLRNEFVDQIMRAAVKGNSVLEFLNKLKPTPYLLEQFLEVRWNGRLLGIISPSWLGAILQYLDEMPKANRIIYLSVFDYDWVKTKSDFVELLLGLKPDERVVMLARMNADDLVTPSKENKAFGIIGGLYSATEKVNYINFLYEYLNDPACAEYFATLCSSFIPDKNAFFDIITNALLNISHITNFIDKIPINWLQKIIGTVNKETLTQFEQYKQQTPYNYILYALNRVYSFERDGPVYQHFWGAFFGAKPQGPVVTGSNDLVRVMKDLRK